MLSLNRNMTVTCHCPYCSETIERTILSIRNNETFHCECGAFNDGLNDDINLQITKIEEKLAALKNNFDDFLKSAKNA